MALSCSGEASDIRVLGYLGEEIAEGLVDCLDV